MSYYKDHVELLGSSDVASLVLRGIQDGKEAVKLLNFGEDGDYQAYLIKNDDEVPSHYHLEEVFQYWMKVYDDDSMTIDLKGDKIEVYKAGMRGCLIRVIE